MPLTLVQQLEEEIRKEVIKRTFPMHAFECTESVGIERGLRKALEIARSVNGNN